MTLAHALARFAATAQAPAEVQRVIAPAVADCFGCILSGAQSEVSRKVQAALAALGEGHTPTYGTSAQLPAPYAALVNAVAGHAWELDDWEELGNTHPSVVLVPALLAAAQLRSASGREMIQAYAVGAEIIMRLGEVISLDHYARGFHATATLGAIGAAGAVARLMGLSADQMAHALAISVSQAVGYTAQFGADAKPLQAGFAARAGVEAAVLAAGGATGQAVALDNPRGFVGLMGDHAVERLEALPDRLGAPWALAAHGLVIKPWPSCGYTHRLMTAALELRPAVQGRLDQITAIHGVMPDMHHAILPFHQPRSDREALFSAPACVAQVLVTGELTLDDCAATFWTVPEVARLIGLTEVTSEPSLDPSRNYHPDQPDRLRITFDGEGVVEASCAYPLGAPQAPMSEGQLKAKWQAVTGREGAVFDRLLDWPAAVDVAAFFREISA